MSVGSSYWVVVTTPCERRGRSGLNGNTYNRVVDILVGGSVARFPLGAIHVPEEAEPLMEERGVLRRFRELRRRKIIWQLPIHVILAVSVHRIISDAIDDVSIFVAASIRSITDNVDLVVSLQKSASAVGHAEAEEILVDVGIQKGARILVGSHMLSRATLLGDRDVVHHRHWRGTNWTAHIAQVGHVNIRSRIHHVVRAQQIAAETVNFSRKVMRQLLADRCVWRWLFGVVPQRAAPQLLPSGMIGYCWFHKAMMYDGRESGIEIQIWFGRVVPVLGR